MYGICAEHVWVMCAQDVLPSNHTVTNCDHAVTATHKPAQPIICVALHLRFLSVDT